MVMQHSGLHAQNKVPQCLFHHSVDELKTRSMGASKSLIPSILIIMIG